MIPIDFIVINTDSMAAVAQLVEPRIVIPVVAGSSPVGRPIFSDEVWSLKTPQIKKWMMFGSLRSRGSLWGLNPQGFMPCWSSHLVHSDISKII